MKLIAMLSLILVLSVSSLAIAQSGGMKDMDMRKCKDMKGMEMGKKVQGTAPKVMTHKATGVVKVVYSSKGTVTLAHGPIKSLNWPAMMMSFSGKDKKLFDYLTVGKKVKVEFSDGVEIGISEMQCFAVAQCDSGPLTSPRLAVTG